MNSKKRNQLAYKSMVHELSQRFPAGRFVAFYDGEIVSDAATFDELTSALASINKDHPDVLVVQAGVTYPEDVFILI